MKVAAFLSSCVWSGLAVQPQWRASNRKLQPLPQTNPRGKTKTGVTFYEEANSRKVYWDILHSLGASNDVANKLVDGDNYILCETCPTDQQNKRIELTNIIILID